MRFFFQTNINGPFVFKCSKCGSRIIDFPKEADTNEILEMPCVIKLTRQGAIIGALIDFWVFLNGRKVAEIDNKQTIEIKTKIKKNILFITDDSGTAFGSYFTFEAVSDNVKELNWSR
jgi:hypothetical protein